MIIEKRQVLRANPDGRLAALADEEVMCSEFWYKRETEIFGQGAPAEYVYQITSGAVRIYKRLLDGRRQINAFHLSGDMFGMESGFSTEPS